MNYWTRFAYSFAFTLVVSIVTLIGLAYVSKEIAYTFLYDYYWVGIFVIAFLLAPLANRFLKRPQE